MPLPEDEKRRFAKRLESFSDIVFGFALAQCAISLELPRSIADAPELIPRLIVFAFTFVIVATFWTMHYRMFRWTFAAERIDNVLNMALLGDIALLPFALQLFFRFRGAPVAYASYAGVLGIAFGLLAILGFRGFRKYQMHIPEPLRLKFWRVIVRHGVSALILLSLVPFIAMYGANASVVFLIIPIMIFIIPRLVKRVPAISRGALAASVAAEGGT